MKGRGEALSQAHSVRVPLQDQNAACRHLLLSALLLRGLGIEREEKRRYKTLAHTSAPSSSTPVSTTVTYLSSIWTRSTVLSM